MLFEQIKEVILEVFKKIVGDIKDINEKLRSIKLFQDYVNTDLEYCYIHDGSGSPSSGANIPFLSLFTTVNSNMELNERFSPLLKAGKKYRVEANVFTNSNNYICYTIKDDNGVYTRLNPNNSAYMSTSSYSSTGLLEYIEPEEDMYINIANNASIAVWPMYSWFKVEEIGRAISVDSGLSNITDEQVEDTISKAIKELNADVRTD